MAKLTQAEARARLWHAGVVAPWYLKDYQFDIYQVLLDSRFPFVEKSRRIGGTTVCLVRVLEFLANKPEGIWRWMEPWKYQAREIVMPEIDRIQESCPQHLKFKFYKTDSFYERKQNGARLYLRGVNEDRGESARGPYAHGLTADEYGSWKDAGYILNEAMLPQVLSTNGPLWRVSSPPKNLGHLYYEEKELAAREGRMVSLNIWRAVPDLYDEKQVLEMCQAVGGENSPAWRREFLCEPVSDPELLIIPEWDDSLNTVPDDHSRPQFFTPYVGGDSGADDNTAVLFGYYDFRKNAVVIEEEYVTRGRTTAEIVAACKKIEAELWGQKDPITGEIIQRVTPHARAYDAPKQLIFDIFADHKWPVRMPQKEDKIAAIHDLRVEVGARRFLVKEKCTHLRRQLKVGMWKDEKHLDFERSEGLGHLDAVAAAIYFNRVIDRTLNPIPHNLGAHRETHFIPERASSLGETETAIKAAFGPRVRRIR
jgi:hypothetical protein